MTIKSCLLVSYAIGPGSWHKNQIPRRSTPIDPKLGKNNEWSSDKYYENLSDENIEAIILNKENDALFTKTGYPSIIWEKMKELSEKRSKEIKYDLTYNKPNIIEFLYSYLNPTDDSFSINADNGLDTSYLEALHKVFGGKNNIDDYKSIMDAQIRKVIARMIIFFIPELSEAYDTLFMPPEISPVDQLSGLDFLKDDDWHDDTVKIEKFFLCHLMASLNNAIVNIDDSKKTLDMELNESKNTGKILTISKIIEKSTALDLLIHMDTSVIEMLNEAVEEYYKWLFKVDFEDDVEIYGEPTIMGKYSRGYSNMHHKKYDRNGVLDVYL